MENPKFWSPPPTHALVHSSVAQPGHILIQQKKYANHVPTVHFNETIIPMQHPAKRGRLQRAHLVSIYPMEAQQPM